MTANFLCYVRLHWWKAYDECLSEERAICLWNPAVFLKLPVGVNS